jgi:hypothetical protein
MMTDSILFYKLKLIKKLLESTQRIRSQLFDELVTNATDPVVYKRRYRMLRHLNIYEAQLLQKIQNFETEDVNDLNDFDAEISLVDIINRSA